jgi:hypothetical protein
MPHPARARGPGGARGSDAGEQALQVAPAAARIAAAEGVDRGGDPEAVAPAA